jgi:exosortase
VSTAIAIERSDPSSPGPSPKPPLAAGEAGITLAMVAARITAPMVVGWGLLAAAFAGVFQHWLYVQNFQSSNHFADWGHAYFVPLVSLYILWQRREELAGTRARVFWPGALVMVAGIAAYVFFIAGYNNHMIQGWSAIVTLFGLLLLMLGPGVMRLAALPLAYLVFAVTISDPIMLKVTVRLQLIASQGAYVLLNVLGITTDIAGNVLTVFPSTGEPIPLNVAEACSGMRQLISFLALGAAVALVACRFWWQRLAVVAMAAPVAILINIVRVAALGVASMWNPEFSRGEAHTFIGTLLLIPAFALYMLIVWVLNRVVRDVPEGGQPA